MKILDKSFDNRSNCCSVLTKMTLSEYAEISRSAFEHGGNIFGQRDVIKKSTVASKIRSRMNDDGGYTRQNKKRFCIHSKGIGLCALLFSTEINNKKIG